MDFKKKTREVWDFYFFGGEEENSRILEMLDPKCVIIGTGKHEFYRNLDEFLTAIVADVKERQDIQFQYKDFWCEEERISNDTCLVYGKCFVWWESEDKMISINMDSRFTMLYKHTEQGWKIVHVHQSLPNVEQEDGEYYPKTLSQKYLEEKEKVCKLSNLASRDSITDLINYRAFQNAYKETAVEGSWLFVADLDDFKSINDAYGHPEGNRVLKETGAALKASVRSADIVCRMGGDEFILLCHGIHNQDEAGMFLNRILTISNNIPLLTGISIGGTSVQNGESLDKVFRRADMALYEAKQTKKNHWQLR